MVLGPVLRLGLGLGASARAKAGLGRVPAPSAMEAKVVPSRAIAPWLGLGLEG